MCEPATERMGVEFCPLRGKFLPRTSIRWMFRV